MALMPCDGKGLMDALFNMNQIADDAFGGPAYDTPARQSFQAGKSGPYNNTSAHQFASGGAPSRSEAGTSHGSVSFSSDHGQRLGGTRDRDRSRLVQSVDKTHQATPQSMTSITSSPDVPGLSASRDKQTGATAVGGSERSNSCQKTEQTCSTSGNDEDSHRVTSWQKNEEEERITLSDGTNNLDDDDGNEESNSVSTSETYPHSVDAMPTIASVGSYTTPATTNVTAVNISSFNIGEDRSTGYTNEHVLYTSPLTPASVTLTSTSGVSMSLSDPQRKGEYFTLVLKQF